MDIYVQNLALVYFQTGDCKEAIATCEKGLKRQPDNLNSHVITAAVYGSCGREKEARKEGSEVLRINPKFTVESYTRNLPTKNPSEKGIPIEAAQTASPCKQRAFEGHRAVNTRSQVRMVDNRT